MRKTVASAAAAAAAAASTKHEKGTAVVDPEIVISKKKRIRVGRCFGWIISLAAAAILMVVVGPFKAIHTLFFLVSVHDDTPPVPYRVDCQDILNHSKDAFQFVQTKTNPPFNMSIYPTSEDVWVSGYIKRSGCWECDIVASLQKALQQHKNAYLLDLGGNIGMHSLAAAAMGRTVYAFEPVKRSYEHICRSVAANGFHDGLNIFSLALTNSTGHVSFKPPKNNQGGNTVKDLSVVQEDWQEGVEYAVAIPLDSIRHLLPLSLPVVIKIDIEGKEIEALEGATSFLRESDIVLLSVELRWPVLQSNPDKTDKVFQVLREKGLSPMLNNRTDLVPLKGDWRNWKSEYGLPGGPTSLFDTTWIRPRAGGETAQ